MKKSTLLFLALALTITTYGQTNNVVVINKNLPLVPAKIANIAVSRNRTDLTAIKRIPTARTNHNQTRASESNFTATQIGQTYYDLQTNGSICNRLVYNADGTIAAMWTFAPSGDDYGNQWPNRGSAYNYFDGSSWTLSANTTSRVETERTGWPQIVDPSNGGEIFVSHNTVIGGLQLTSRAAKGTGNWTENTDTLKGPTVAGNWWPRMVSVGDTIHEISITYTPGGHDTLYHGQSGAILYSRSTDGGATWGIKQALLPLIDSVYYNGFGGDEYSIDAKGDTVAIVAGGFDNDVVLLKSTDNGNTWTKTIIFQFAIPHYVFGAKTDTGNGKADTLETNDGSLAVLLDNSGAAHVWYGFMKILCLSADSNYYFPGSNGLVYWNENTDSLKIITGAFDSLGEVSNFGRYNQGFCSFPSPAIDDSGHIFVSFSAVDGGEADPSGYAVRHVYLIGTKDGGHTWGYHNSSTGTDVETDDPTSEGMYASMARHVDNNVRLIYQKDYYAGVSTTADANGQVNPSNNDEQNLIMFIEQPTNELLYISGIADVAKNDIGVAMYPNPTDGDVNISFKNYTGQASVVITNILGSTVKQYNNVNVASNNLSLNLSDLVSGVYFIEIKTAQGSATQKIVIASKN